MKDLFGVFGGENPLGRIGNPDELRGVVTWLASDASSFCTGSEYVSSYLTYMCSIPSVTNKRVFMIALLSAVGIMPGENKMQIDVS